LKKKLIEYNRIIIIVKAQQSKGEFNPVMSKYASRTSNDPADMLSAVISSQHWDAAGVEVHMLQSHGYSAVTAEYLSSCVDEAQLERHSATTTPSSRLKTY
jgi:hypothetical protein